MRGRSGPGQDRDRHAATRTAVDEYLWIALGQDALARGEDGELVLVQLVEGDAVRVWIDGGCGESLPLACDIVAIEAVRPVDS